MPLDSITPVNKQRTQQSQSLKDKPPKTSPTSYFATAKNDKENINPQNNISTGPSTPKRNTFQSPAQADTKNPKQNLKRKSPELSSPHTPTQTLKRKSSELSSPHTPTQTLNQQSDYLSPPYTPKYEKMGFNDTDQTQQAEQNRSSSRQSGFLFNNSTKTIVSGSSAIIAEISESLTQREIPHYSDTSNTNRGTLMPLNSFNGKIQCATPTKGTPKSKTPLAIENKFLGETLPRKDCISIKVFSDPSHVSINQRVDDSNNASICPPIIKEGIRVSTYAKTTITDSDSVQRSRVLTKELCALGITIKRNYFQVEPNKFASKDFNITQQQVKKASAEDIIEKWYNESIQPSDKISKESKQYLKLIIENSKQELRHANPKVISGRQSQTADNLFPGPRGTNCFDYGVERALVEVSSKNNITFNVAVISTCSTNGEVEHKRKYRITIQRSSEIIDIIEIKYATFLISSPPEDFLEIIKCVLNYATKPPKYASVPDLSYID